MQQEEEIFKQESQLSSRGGKSLRVVSERF